MSPEIFDRQKQYQAGVDWDSPPIDPGMSDVIRSINAHTRMLTLWCCSGHPDTKDYEGYLVIAHRDRSCMDAFEYALASHALAEIITIDCPDNDDGTSAIGGFTHLGDGICIVKGVYLTTIRWHCPSLEHRDVVLQHLTDFAKHMETNHD